MSAAARLRALQYMAGGLVVTSIPVGVWWKRAVDERTKLHHDVDTRLRIPGVQTTDDFLIEQCRPGDVLVFDRRCEKCASGPWAALACLASKQFLCDPDRILYKGSFDHCGLIVPGFQDRQNTQDPSNLVLLEATPQGIVARSLQARLERTTSRSVLLLRLCGPGEQRGHADAADSSTLRSHMDRQLTHFRDRWLAVGRERRYDWLHSTLTLGGAVASYALSTTPTKSPAASLVQWGLQYAGVAVRDNTHTPKVEDYLRDYRRVEENVVRLRPGWRFLPPLSLREAQS